MLNLKRFLDGLAGEDHPFRKGPDLEEGSALGRQEPARGDEALKEQPTRFYFSRANKN